nr:MAG TPA: hypothetical protein [Caudoviricetes sp.]
MCWWSGAVRYGSEGSKNPARGPRRVWMNF